MDISAVLQVNPSLPGLQLGAGVVTDSVALEPCCGLLAPPLMQLLSSPVFELVQVLLQCKCVQQNTSSSLVLF
jgi:hypothetical protein